MPELPEVETVRMQLQRKIVGKKIAKVEILHPKIERDSPTLVRKLKGKTIDDIDRVGKLMIFSFVGEDDLFLLAHLKMTGQFFYIEQDEVVGGGHVVTAPDHELPHRHTRLAFHFTDHTTLYFNDMRLFGYVKVATAKEVAHARSRFGPEPINPDFDCEWFYEKLKKRKTPIKAALLDQTFIAGLGNIYVDEALWRAKVLPMRQANLVNKKEAMALCVAAGNVMNESIAVGGTTFQHFKDTGGENGNFTDYLQVFGQQGKTCSRCGGIIQKTRCAGRGTHYCPHCQK
jgi:formamidopyrimidine-DNA glycosylase